MPDNYTIDVKEKISDWYEITITQPFWVGKSIWQVNDVICTFIPPLHDEGVVLYYDQENTCMVRIPLTHCRIKKFEFVVRTTVETFWNHWEEDGILPAEVEFFGENVL